MTEAARQRNRQGSSATRGTSPARRWRRASPWFACLATAASLHLSACTKVDLYGVGLEDASPDRLGVTGRVCTDDPRAAGFPVKILFLVDVAQGPLFSSFDPELVRLEVLRDTLSVHEGNETFSFAVAAMGSAPQVLAPAEGYFTRNPGELDAAISMLSFPEACVAGVCRDYTGGLDIARAVIEGDMASVDAGKRSRTQYVAVLMSAGPPSPLSCETECCSELEETCDDVCIESWPCSGEVQRDRVLDLRASIEQGGALSFSLHTMFLAAPDASAEDPETALENTGALLQDLAFAGAGRFEQFDTPDAITLERIGLLKLSSLLEVKSLLVVNTSTLPGPEGLEMDSDGDGLTDLEESTLGTEPFAPDTDGDGIGDLIELLITFDPLEWQEPPAACDSEAGTPFGDRDGDRLNDCEERILGTDPSLPDTDGDALPDALEVVFGTDYLGADYLEDSDWDGATNGDEVLVHTDPRSSDATSHLADAYRYSVVDEGTVLEPVVQSPKQVPGVLVLEAGDDSSAGVGTLVFELEEHASLSWQDPQDSGPGPARDVSMPGDYTLASASASGGLERWLIVRVTPALLPPNPVRESLLVEVVERECISYTVRNIRLLETGGVGDQGLNRVYIYFAEGPAERLEQPGLFRVAEVPVVYNHETGREPADLLIEVNDGEFFAIGQ